METNRVPAAEATAARLDAEYYKLAFREAASAVRRFGSTTNLEGVRAQSTPIRRGIDMPRFVDDAQAPRMVTIASFSDPGIDFSGLEGIDPSQHADFRASQLTAGDLVVAMGGYVGRAAICPPNPPVANIGRHSARVVVDSNKADPYFLWSFLTSAIGELQLKRQVTGSVQAGINLEDLRVVELPRPTTEAQRYIGDKVRQAERLRERARRLQCLARELASFLFERLIDEESVLALLRLEASDEQLGALRTQIMLRPRLSSIDAHRETKHCNRIPAAALTTLWTASSYRPEITDAIAHLRSSRWQPLSALCREPIVQGRTPTYADGEIGYPCLKTRHVSGLFVDDSEPDCVTAECAAELARFAVAPGTILMNRSGAGSVGRSGVYLGDGSPLTNEHLLHIRLQPENDPCFVALFLSSWWGERAIEQGVTGSTGQLNLANEHVSQIPVPMVHRNVQTGVGSLVRTAAACASQARALVGAAKLLVEQLIDGRLPEADLIAARKALEGGDRSADRELLKALRHSEGPDAKPLIAEVDSLYALLDELEGQDA